MGVRWWRLAACFLLNYALSWVWFTWLFRAPYLAGLGKTQEELDRGPSTLVASLIQLLALVLLTIGAGILFSFVAALFRRTSVAQRSLVALVAWCAGPAAVLWPMSAFQAWPNSLTWISLGYPALAFWVCALLLKPEAVKSARLFTEVRD